MWKIILIVAVVAIFAWGFIPTKSHPETIRLGLDLKGGTHLVMQVNTGDAVKAEVDQAIERLKTEAEKQKLPAPKIKRVDQRTFIVMPPNGIPTDGYESVAHDWLPNFQSSTTQDGFQLEMKPNATAALEDQTVSQAIETIRNRIDSLGVTEPVIAREGGLRGDRIVIQLPGVDDPARVKHIIKTTAQLQFRIVEGTPAPDKATVIKSLPPGVTQNDVQILPGESHDDFGRVTGQEYYALQKSVPVTGRDLKTARVQKGRLGEPIIGFSLTPEGAKKFGALTGSNVGRQLAIVLDNKVKSAPKINSRIDDQGIIEGSFTQQSASDLALVLRSGSLPASLTTLEERTVGPSLGLDSIKAGVTGSVLGFLAMVTAVLFYYKGAGVNATVALLLNLILVLGAMAYFHATLTLPGIAGIILTLAMAIDSNVLVFERIREELRNGKSVRASIDQGFSLAFGTIIDSNATTMIAALFLFQFGSGPVRGFAVTLLIGLSASLFTAFFVSRVIFDWFYNRGGQRPTHVSI